MTGQTKFDQTNLLYMVKPNLTKKNLLYIINGEVNERIIEIKIYLQTIFNSYEYRDISSDNISYLGLKRIVYFDIRIFFNFQMNSPNILLHIKVVK